MIKDAGENGPRSETSAILKEQHQNFAKQFIDKWIAKYVFFSYLCFSRLNRLELTEVSTSELWLFGAFN